MIALPSTTVEIEVPFHDVDTMNVVWHGHYYKYFEIARTALLRSIHYDVPDMMESGYAWPVIESNCRYIAPLRYGMKAKVIATVKEYEHRLKILYSIVDPTTNCRLAKGFTSQVAISIETQEMCLVSPPVLFQKLGGLD